MMNGVRQWLQLLLLGFLIACKPIPPFPPGSSPSPSSQPSIAPSSTPSPQSSVNPVPSRTPPAPPGPVLPSAGIPTSASGPGGAGSTDKPGLINKALLGQGRVGLEFNQGQAEAVIQAKLGALPKPQEMRIQADDGLHVGMVYQLLIDGQPYRFVVLESELKPDRTYQIEVKGLKQGSHFDVSFESDLSPIGFRRVETQTVSVDQPRNEITVENVPVPVDSNNIPLVIKKNLNPHAAYPGDDSNFVTDITYPDNFPKKPGERFTKIWAIQNAGTQIWEGRRLVNIDQLNIGSQSCTGGDGYLIPEVTEVSVPRTFPGQILFMSVNMRVPENASLNTSLRSTWKFKGADPLGKDVFLFPSLQGVYVQIRVSNPDVAAPASSYPLNFEESKLYVPNPDASTSKTFADGALFGKFSEEDLFAEGASVGNFLVKNKTTIPVMWKIKNLGSQPIQGYKLLNIDKNICEGSGYLTPKAVDSMGNPSGPESKELKIPDLEPNQEAAVLFSLTTPPEVPGVIRSTWAVVDHTGKPTGQEVYIQLSVEQPPLA